MSLYTEKLKDPRWQKLRLEIFQRDGWRCRICFRKDRSLQVHHRYYERVEPWDYPPDALVTLCEDCHKDEPAQLVEYVKDFQEDLATTPLISQELSIIHDLAIILARSPECGLFRELEALDEKYTILLDEAI